MPIFGLSIEAASVVIITNTAITWSLLTLGIRIFLRSKINGPLGWDDFFCTTATLHRSEFFLWVAYLFFFPALACSMLSISSLLARIIGPHRRTVRVAHAIALAIVMWGGVCEFVFAFSCALPRPWVIAETGGRCINLFAFNAGVSVAMLVLETCNIILALHIVWRLQMHRADKCTVLAAFSVRWIMIPPTLARLRFIHSALASPNWNFSRTGAVIFMQVMLHLSLILATLPCAKPFLVVFESGGLLNPPLSNRGSGERRQRIQSWELTLRPPEAGMTRARVEHDPVDAAVRARRRSAGSSESAREGITRTASFSVLVGGEGEGEV
ncbi:MAG: hypothetical protein FE78DRAFT_146155 [Acidomyces sp. 'richmondensis']|nr:MAG: hypothetical protein FE78DRAFT_146155 [Acidomyces sp. 'richmondensis']